jgi:hypothetical protein
MFNASANLTSTSYAPWYYYISNSVNVVLHRRFGKITRFWIWTSITEKPEETRGVLGSWKRLFNMWLGGIISLILTSGIQVSGSKPLILLVSHLAHSGIPYSNFSMDEFHLQILSAPHLQYLALSSSRHNSAGVELVVNLLPNLFKGGAPNLTSSG